MAYKCLNTKMVSDKNKIQEDVHFEIFKSCCNNFPPNSYVKHDDNPDFLIKHSAGILGVELTQLFKVDKHPNAPQALESFREQIVESAKKICEDIPPLMVHVWFNFNLKVPKNRMSEIKRISRSLAEIIKRWHQENPSEHYRCLKTPIDESSIFFQISIMRTQIPFWKVDSGAVQINYSNFTIEKIQDLINEKNLLYEKYRRKCDECWLLIIGNLFKDSQSFEMPEQIGHRFEPKFERIYYLDASHRKTLNKLPINLI